MKFQSQVLYFPDIFSIAELGAADSRPFSTFKTLDGCHYYIHEDPQLFRNPLVDIGLESSTPNDKEQQLPPNSGEVVFNRLTTFDKVTCPPVSNDDDFL